MDLINAIGFIASLFGIYSFVKNDTSLFSLLKKNLFLSARVLPYGLDTGLLLLKKI
jgi:hypothetical protein